MTNSHSLGAWGRAKRELFPEWRHSRWSAWTWDRHLSAAGVGCVQGSRRRWVWTRQWGEDCKGFVCHGAWVGNRRPVENPKGRTWPILFILKIWHSRGGYMEVKPKCGCSLVWGPRFFHLSHCESTVWQTEAEPWPLPWILNPHFQRPTWFSPSVTHWHPETDMSRLETLIFPHNPSPISFFSILINSHKSHPSAQVRMLAHRSFQSCPHPHLQPQTSPVHPNSEIYLEFIPLPLPRLPP